MTWFGRFARMIRVNGHTDGSVHQFLALGSNAEHIGDEQLRDVPLIVV